MRTLIGLFLACTLVACVQPTTLFDLTQVTLDKKDAKHPEVIGESTLTLDTAAIAPDKVLAIKLPSGETLTFETIRKEEKADGTVVWTASTDKKRYETSTFVLNKGVLTASIKLADGRTFRIVHVKGPTYRIQQIDRTKIPAEACSQPAKVPKLRIRTAYQMVQQPTEGRACPDDGSQIDVMVVYTAAALAEAAQPPAGVAPQVPPNIEPSAQPGTPPVAESIDAVATMEGAIEIAVSEANVSYFNSNVAQRLNLLRPIRQVAYVESGLIVDDLDNLIDSATPELAQVHADRDAMAADIVVLVTSEAADCGLAYTMAALDPNVWSKRAFAVVPYRCLFDNLSFAHELGHIMGARHDKFVDATSGAPYPYNHGRAASQPTGNPPHPWFTVMATSDACSHARIANCLRIQFWSNPQVNYYDMATGIENESDNRQTLNNTAPTVARYRCSTSRAPPSPR